MVNIMENLLKMDDLGGYPYFLETSKWKYIRNSFHCPRVLFAESFSFRFIEGGKLPFARSETVVKQRATGNLLKIFQDLFFKDHSMGGS